MSNLLALYFKLSEIRKIKKQFTARRNTPAAISAFTSGKDHAHSKLSTVRRFSAKHASEGIFQYKI